MLTIVNPLFKTCCCLSCNLGNNIYKAAFKVRKNTSPADFGYQHLVVKFWTTRWPYLFKSLRNCMKYDAFFAYALVTHVTHPTLTLAFRRKSIGGDWFLMKTYDVRAKINDRTYRHAAPWKRDLMRNMTMHGNYKDDKYLMMVYMK